MKQLPRLIPATIVVAGLIAVPPIASGPMATASTMTQFAQQVSTSESHAQAVRMARNYLSFSAFSRKGLISQLKYEGFSSAVSTRAVDSLRVNWNKQAAKKAKEYLEYQAFSAKGLLSQLRYEGFTTSQARYGVRAAGL